MAQFRLRTLFIATTGIAVLFWALYAPPQWLGLLAMYAVYLLLPATTAAGVIFHRGYWQAFFIGVAPWVVIVALSRVAFLPSSIFSSTLSIAGGFEWPLVGELIPSDEDQVTIRKLQIAVWLGVALVSGLVAVGVRWWAIVLQQRSDQKALN